MKTNQTRLHVSSVFRFINQTFEPPRWKTNNVVSEQVRHKPTCTENKGVDQLLGYLCRLLVFPRGGSIIYIVQHREINITLHVLFFFLKGMSGNWNACYYSKTAFVSKMNIHVNRNTLVLIIQRCMVIRLYHFSHEQINNGKYIQSVEANSKLTLSLNIVDQQECICYT